MIRMFIVQGTRRTLILREIPEDGVKKLLSNRDCLAACDVAVFVYDRYGAVQPSVCKVQFLICLVECRMVHLVTC